MINVRALANMATQNVNPNRTVKLKVNTGYTVNEYGEQVPSFIEEEIEVQIQSLSSQEKFNLDLVNKQGEFVSIYAFGAIDGIRRWLGKGSSKFIFPAYGESAAAEWQVNQVMESYATWTRVLAWRQS
ncbi:hypothetical protein [Methylobacillus sp.]|uniref:hypothetical protein n=1 Tax=Methylobacillus sp. TaxID=56818 RepID=UPI002FE11728